MNINKPQTIIRKFIATLWILILFFPALSYAQPQSVSFKPHVNDAPSIWHGFKRLDFTLQSNSNENIPAHIVLPNKPLPGNPWVWRARFPEWHTQADSILLSRGFHIAYINTNNRFGSPKAMAIWDAFYQYITQKFQLSPKVALEGVSRGGLFIYTWAKQNPEKINAIYAEAPVCDFKSWPAGYGNGQKSDNDWKKLKAEYGFRSNEEALEWNKQPIHHLDELAKAKVPILHMVGLNDQIVPPTENTFQLVKRYINLGGPATIIPCTKGKQTLKGHHFPIETPQLVADFIIYNTPIPKQKIAASNYHQLRKGIRNSYMKFQRQKFGRVAFLGGSITYNGGWRDSICNYLQKRFPDTQFEFIAAGIPSMGTTPAAFRLQRDVLSKGKIDLLFEEAAVNDASNGRTNTEQVRAMEGIVRHTLQLNPECDIVLMHFVDPDKMATYRSGKTPQVILNHEAVAKHYQLPSINLAKEVTDRIDAGEFTWENDFKNLHPSPFGQGIYSHSMLAFLDKAWAGFIAEDDKIQMHTLPAPIDPDSYHNGSLISIQNAKKSKGWKIVEKWKPNDKKGTRANYVNVPMLVGNAQSGILKFNFEGSAVGIAIAAGPDAGVIEYAIDNGEWQKQQLFTQWSKHLHLPWYYTLATGLSNKKHTLKLRVTNQKHSQSTGNTCRIRYFYINN
jgi:sialidase-1